MSTRSGSRRPQSSGFGSSQDPRRPCGAVVVVRVVLGVDEVVRVARRHRRRRRRRPGVARLRAPPWLAPGSRSSGSVAASVRSSGSAAEARQGNSKETTASPSVAARGSNLKSRARETSTHMKFLVCVNTSSSAACGARLPHARHGAARLANVASTPFLGLCGRGAKRES